MIDGPAALPSRRRRLRAGAASDPGLLRSHNEDVVLCEPELGLFAVIDGVGGEVAGEKGAQTAADILLRRLRRREGGALEAEIREAIALANNRIFDLAGEDRRLQGMSCVLTVAVVDGERVLIGHVGDSRLYRLSRGRIEKLTRDHSPVGDLEDRGELSELEAMRHPRRNEIYRDVGTAYHRPDDPEFVEVAVAPFGPEQALLLCSDGLTDQVPSAEIRDMVERWAGDPERAARALVQRANAAGGKDNVSVVVIEGERFAAALRPEAAGSGARRGSGSEDTRRLRAVRPDSAAAATPRRPGKPAPGIDATASERPMRAPAPAGRERPRPTAVAGAAAARAERMAPRGRLRAGWLARVLLAVAVILLVGAAGWVIGRGGGLAAFLPKGQPLRVGPEAKFATITAALQAARRGQTIEVEPGIYRERLELRSGVRLRSQVPRGAVLEPRREGTLDEQAAVAADRVVDAAFEGFRVSGAGGVEVGLLLHDSAVDVVNVEIAGIPGDAVVSSGADRSSVRYSHLHGNGGAAVRVRAPAAPRLLENLVRANGSTKPPVAAVEIDDGSAPLLVGNRFTENRGPAVAVGDASAVAEIEGLNEFPGAEPGARVVVQSPAPEATRSAESEP